MMFLVVLVDLQAVAAVKEVFIVSRFFDDVIWIPDNDNHFLAVERLCLFIHRVAGFSE